ncbi:hypothetical protein [Aureimonas jatrophae]|uniref:Uncharacterized protein n=1 Tax=Aureimonas jatrophae TaxID=1166073 RepID=A0A1H0CV74_9HYPH|nr:hypothetical protein [Aureimonas jatrophae]MBB3949375.1 hypothetical protein [Aureimonas jatrophae]SDN61797.1 hypothetical protein SAMN05192530_101479 [Aureimonas jatrophae]
MNVVLTTGHTGSTERAYLEKSMVSRHVARSERPVGAFVHTLRGLMPSAANAVRLRDV